MTAEAIILKLKEKIEEVNENGLQSDTRFRLSTEIVEHVLDNTGNFPEDWPDEIVNEIDELISQLDCLQLTIEVNKLEKKANVV